MTSPPSRPPSAVSARRRPPGAALVWLALVIVYVVWGSTYLGIRIAAESLPAFLSAGVRHGLAAVIVGTVIAVRRGPGALRVGVRQFGAAGLVGVLLLAGGNGLVVLAESAPFAVPSGVAALLVATVPLLVVVLRAATGDRPATTTFLGVAVGFAGLIVLVLPAGGVPAGSLTGSLIVVAAAVSWSVGSFSSRRLPLPRDPFVATVYQMVCGSLVLLALGAGRGELRGFDAGQASGRSWAALAYLVVAGSVIAFTAYVWLLHRAPISLVSTYAYVNPAVAVLLGALFVAEPLTARVLVGGAIIVAGVALVVATERPRTAATAPEPAAAAGAEAGPPRAA